jgi:DNA-binding Lrp family transcriptional regulator
MSDVNTVFGETFYRNTWEMLQKPENRHIIEVLEAKNQLDEEDVMERVDLSEEEFYDVSKELEDEGVIDHYDREHSRGPQTVHMSLYRAVYPAETALEFDDEEKYVQHMLDNDEEMFEEYSG